MAKNWSGYNQPFPQMTRANRSLSYAGLNLPSEMSTLRSSQSDFATTTDLQDLHKYSEEERMIILGVLKKDLELRSVEKMRLQKMRHRLLADDRKSIFPQLSPICVICEVSFVVLFNPRKRCDLCHRSICKECSNFYTEVQELLCKLCSRNQFYKAMVHQWFYDNAPNKFSEHASNAIVKKIFKDRLPPIATLSDEKLHDIVSLYLGPTRNAVINDRLITPEIMKKIKKDQLNSFRKKYKETKELALAMLAAIKSDIKLSDNEREKRTAQVTNKFLKQAKSHLEQLLQMLCITTEKNNIALGLDSKHTNVRVIHIAHKEMETIVGHSIKLPPEFLVMLSEEDWESYVGSVTGGPEEFLSKFFVEDLRNAMENG